MASARPPRRLDPRTPHASGPTIHGSSSGFGQVDTRVVFAVMEPFLSS
jgi:hypothetical protein